MTKKNYTLIADALIEAFNKSRDSSALSNELWVNILGSMADTLQADNNRFSRTTWITYIAERLE